MAWQSKFILVSLLLTVIANAQSPTVGRSLTEGARTTGYWVDPSTGLMWAGKDNGKDVNWHTAKNYCHDLRLAGYSDWRLATIDELEGIYDTTANAPGVGSGKHGDEVSTWHVKGNLSLTGKQWSSTQRLDDRGRPNGLVWYFDFWNKYRGSDDGSRFSGHFADYNRRALCVRTTRQ